jgi:hypothetical protein
MGNTSGHVGSRPIVSYTKGTRRFTHWRQRGSVITVIDLAENHPTLEEVVGLAKDKVVVLRQPDGSVFAISQLSDFEVEVELLSNNPDFLSFLRQASHEDATISLEDLRSELAL